MRNIAIQAKNIYFFQIGLKDLSFFVDGTRNSQQEKKAQFFCDWSK
jgi:hypothetical protein